MICCSILLPIPITTAPCSPSPASPSAVADAAFAVARTALQKIDLTRHAGVHPRLGAVDVIPFVPIEGMSSGRLRGIARCRPARACGTNSECRCIYMKQPRCAPNRAASKTSGAWPRNGRPISAQDVTPQPAPASWEPENFLIAWNINLRTADLAAAQTIARHIRASSGGLPAVKALGLPLESPQSGAGLHQPRRFRDHAPACRLRSRGRSLREAPSIEIEGSELIGMIPAGALAASAGHDLRWLNLRDDLILENRLRSAKLTP